MAAIRRKHIMKRIPDRLRQITREVWFWKVGLQIDCAMGVAALPGIFTQALEAQSKAQTRRYTERHGARK